MGLWVCGLQVTAEEIGAFGGVADQLLTCTKLLLGRVPEATELPVDAAGYTVGTVAELVPKLDSTMQLVYRMVGWLNDLNPNGTPALGWRDVNSCGIMSADPGMVAPATQQLFLTLSSHGLYCIDESKEPETRFNYAAKEDLRRQMRELVKSIRVMSQEDDQRASTGVTVFYELSHLPPSRTEGEGLEVFKASPPPPSPGSHPPPDVSDSTALRPLTWMILVLGVGCLYSGGVP